MSGESKNMSEVSEVNQKDRETRLRHQFQSHWDERERLHEQDLTELRQRRVRQVQAERTQKEDLERELARVNRELVAVRQDAELLGHADSVRLREELLNLQRIHKLQADQILKANEEKQELRNQVMLARERFVESQARLKRIEQSMGVIIAEVNSLQGDGNE